MPALAAKVQPTPTILYCAYEDDDDDDDDDGDDDGDDGDGDGDDDSSLRRPLFKNPPLAVISRDAC